MIRVILPYPLKTLAHVDGEVKLSVEGPVTISSVLDALEALYPMLKGTTRDHVTPAKLNEIRKKVPIRRLGRLEEAASAVRFILSNDYVNGKVIDLDGGLVL